MFLGYMILDGRDEVVGVNNRGSLLSLVRFQLCPLIFALKCKSLSWRIRLGVQIPSRIIMTVSSSCHNHLMIRFHIQGVTEASFSSVGVADVLLAQESSYSTQTHHLKPLRAMHMQCTSSTSSRSPERSSCAREMTLILFGPLRWPLMYHTIKGLFNDETHAVHTFWIH